MEGTQGRSIEAVEVEAISKGRSVATGFSWLGKGSGGSRGLRVVIFTSARRGHSPRRL